MLLTLPVSLDHSQTLNRICSLSVYVLNALLGKHILVPVSIQITLKLSIGSISSILRVEHVLKTSHFRFSCTELLYKV